MALQSCDPGSSFVEIVQQLAKHGATQRTTLMELTRCESMTKHDLSRNFRGIHAMLNRELDNLGELRAVAPAAAFFKKQCADYMKLRSTSQDFELAFFAEKFSLDMLLTLLRARPSCPLVEVGMQPDEGRFSIFFDPPPTADLIQSIGMLQGMMQVAADHFGRSLLPTAGAVTSGCLFYSACGAPLARQPGAPCRTAPWEAFSVPPPAEGLCWYGAGVAISRGRSDLA